MYFYHFTDIQFACEFARLIPYLLWLSTKGDRSWRE